MISLIFEPFLEGGKDGGTDAFANSKCSCVLLVFGLCMRFAVMF